MITKRIAAVFLGLVLLTGMYFVWQQYQSFSAVSDEPQEVINEVDATEEQSATSTPSNTLTQADCDTAENPYDCDRERVLAQLGNPTRDERRGEIIEGETMNTYRNEFWGFQFEYPKEWTLKEYSYGASYSLFNVSIWSTNLSETVWGDIDFNVSLDRWWGRVLALDAGDDISWHQTRDIGGEEWRYPDKLHPSITLPNQHYILNQGEYWLTINTTLGFEDVPTREQLYDEILNSFEFIEINRP